MASKQGQVNKGPQVFFELLVPAHTREGNEKGYEMKEYVVTEKIYIIV